MPTRGSILSGYAAIAAAALSCAALASVEPPFFDSFDDGASPLWGNEVGNWFARDGVYSAAQPGNFPNAHSALPFDLTEFVVELDVNDLSDGGVWLRSTTTPGQGVGISGVLLVTKGTGLYWHVVPPGAGYGAAINPVSGLFPAGADVHLRIVVRCNVYSVYVDGAAAAATTVQTDLFKNGQVALYDFSGQTFDNVDLTEPFEPCDADLTGDCLVDGADLGALLASWGQGGAADLSGDGVVDGADLGILLSAWGPC